MKGLTALAALLFAFAATPAIAGDGDKILGVYRVLGEDTNIWSDVQFTKTGDKYEARVIWLERTTDQSGNTLLDVNNPDPKLRQQPADRIRVIWGIEYDDRKDIWTGGKVYNPVDGKIYDVQVSFDNPDTLKIRGYVGTPMLGRSLYWTRKK